MDKGFIIKYLKNTCILFMIICIPLNLELSAKELQSSEEAIQKAYAIVGKKKLNYNFL